MDLSLERQGSATVVDVVRDMSSVAGNLAGDLVSGIEDSSSLEKSALSGQSGGMLPSISIVTVHHLRLTYSLD